MSGRKRHLLVDTIGLVLRVVVHAADIPDRDGAKLVLTGSPQRFPRVAHLCLDAGYQGGTVTWIAQEVGGA